MPLNLTDSEVRKIRVWLHRIMTDKNPKRNAIYNYARGIGLVLTRAERRDFKNINKKYKNINKK